MGATTAATSWPSSALDKRTGHRVQEVGRDVQQMPALLPGHTLTQSWSRVRQRGPLGSGRRDDGAAVAEFREHDQGKSAARHEDQEV